MSGDKKIKKFIGITATMLGTVFAGMEIWAKMKKDDSVYKDEPSEQNPMEGKKVVFIEDDNDLENADGVRGHLEAIGDSECHPGFYEKYVKRALDVVLSFGGLLVLSPIFIGLSIAIFIDDPGPVFFTQKRLGQNKKYFKLHKFRSMKMSTPHDVPTHMLDNPDQYITKVGKFIRAHSLDELPQIWDIFVNNMSVIGPRPGLWNQDVLTAERDKYGANDVKPGLTGWAQINGRDELEISDKAKLDGEYAQKIGFAMDLKCFLGSVGVFGGDDSVVEGGTGEMAKAERHYTDGKTDKELIGHIGFGEPVEVDLSAMKKVLITGAGSYIGESFKNYASEKYGNNFEIEEIDMLDDTWRECDFSEYDIVYHVAEIAHADVGNVSEAVKAKYYVVNTDLAVEVAKKAKKDGVKEFIFMSSMIVYGDSAPYGKEKIINEYTVPSPANFYGDSKLQADVAVRCLADETFRVIVLRPPMIYGRGSKGNYPTLAKLAKKLPVFPNIDNQRSMLHIDNLCEFLCQIMLVNRWREKAIVLIPQNEEWVRTSNMVKMIADSYNKNIVVSSMLNPLVGITSVIPGKIGGLVNKAFGNNCYSYTVSKYEGINYWAIDFNGSIVKTESENDKKKIVFDNKLENLQEKKILLIALPGYSNGIISKMKEMGAQVDYIHDKPNEGFIAKTLGRLGFRFYQNILNKYYAKSLEALKEKEYDFILVIRGEYTPKETLELLKEKYSSAKLILYMWDGLHKQNTRGIEKKWCFYDKVYTFDRIDYEANKENIFFLPLYYYDEYLPKNIKSANNTALEYDLSFIGTGHDDRVAIVKRLMEQGNKNGLNCFSYFYMPHKLVYIKNKLFNKSFKEVNSDDLKYEMLPFEKLYNIYANSRCVIDVENRGQHGLTMRSIEILGLKRKFITTNEDIVNYDFYNPRNILVIKRDDPQLDMDFFYTPYEELSEEVYKKYSLENWILEVLK